MGGPALAVEVVCGGATYWVALRLLRDGAYRDVVELVWQGRSAPHRGVAAKGR